jgi:serine/threonine protein kinase
LRIKKISASAREKLHDKKLLSIDLKELEKNIDGMNREQINSEIINCLNFKAKDNDDEKSIVDILRKLLSLSEAEDLHKLFNNPENRYTLVTKFPQIIFPIEAKSPKTKAGKKFIKEFSKIKELIGDDLCAHWILGDEVVHRLDLSARLKTYRNYLIIQKIDILW